MQQHFRLIMMQLAVDCNNLGVKYNEQGQWQDALEMFQGSLQLVMYLSTKYKTEVDVIQNDLCIQRAQFMLEQSKRYPSKVLRQPKRRANHDFVFTNAIEMDHNGLGSESYELKCASVLFNTALSFHLLSLEIPGNTERNGYKAHQLYNMSYQVACVLHLHGNVAVCRFLTGVLNNLGMLENDQGQFELSRSYFSALSSLLHCLPASSNVVVVEERRGLLLNSFILDQRMTAGAA